MRSKWRTVRVGDLGRVVTGKTPKTAITDNYGGSVLFLTPSDDMSVKYVETTAKTLTSKGLSEVKNCLLPPRTICVSCIGSDLGKVVMTTQPTVTNQQINSIIPADNVDPDFVYYAMTILGKELNYISKTSTAVPIVNKSSFSSYTIDIPPLDDQRSIASVLSALDTKITENRKINHHLEQIAQAIFKSWFVDFEPFGGEMPGDWREGTFSEVISTTLGGDWGKDAPIGNNTQEVYCIRGADIPDVNVGNKGKMPIRFILRKNYASKRLAVGDIVVEISGGSPTQSTGRCALITQSLLERYDRGMVCTNFCRAVKPLEGYSAFVYFYWKYLYDQNVMFSYENGTTGIKNLNITGFLENEPIIIPSVDVVAKFNEAVEIFIDTIFANGLENECLANTRDTLLPRLMSGELSVTEISDAK